MAKQKRTKKVTVPVRPVPAAPLPVLHGDTFRSFIQEARDIGVELDARRMYDGDVVEFLQQKGLFEEWGRWREAKRAPKQTP